MIIYLHGFDSNSPGNHEKVMQLQFIDPDVRLISYSTRHPKHDMQHLLKEVDKMLQLTADDRPLICGVGLGGYWAERIGFLCDIRQAVFNPNLFPHENMEGKIDRPEEYADIATKCVTNFREKNRDRCLVVLSRQDEALDSQRSADLLHHYYEIIWDEEQTHKFKNISPHLQRLKAFKPFPCLQTRAGFTARVFSCLHLLVSLKKYATKLDAHQFWYDQCTVHGILDSAEWFH